MPEYVCAVTKSHKRLYGQTQESAPVCCGKPMVATPELVPVPPQPASGAQPAAASAEPRSPWPREPATIPQNTTDWWKLWK